VRFVGKIHFYFKVANSLLKQNRPTCVKLKTKKKTRLKKGAVIELRVARDANSARSREEFVSFLSFEESLLH